MKEKVRIQDYDPEGDRNEKGTLDLTYHEELEAVKSVPRKD